MTVDKLLRRLGSAKLAAWIIAIFMGMTVLVVLLPQKAYLGAQFEQFVKDVPLLASIMESTSLDRIFVGWPVAVISSLLAVNVAACTIVRLRARRRIPSVAVARDALATPLAPGLTPDEYLDRAVARLATARFTPLVRSADGVVARAGGSGFWGSMLLHGSLLIIIAGGVATALTSFTGEMVITDGQTVTDSAESYTKVTNEPELGATFSGTRISMQSTEVTYDRGVVVSAVAIMRALDPSGKVVDKAVRVNQPLNAGGKDYLLQNSGYAVALVLGDEAGGSQAATVRLGERTPRGWRDSIDLGQVGGRAMRVEMTATPVPLGTSAEMPAEEFSLDDPRLLVRVYSEGESVWSGVLREGESIPADTGVVLTFEKLQLWNRFLVRGEPGRWLTYVGLWLAVAGSAWRFAIAERRLSVAVRESEGAPRVHVSLRTRPWAGFHAASDSALTSDLLELAATPIPKAGLPREKTRNRA